MNKVTIKIPRRVRVGGQLMETQLVEELDDKYGMCCIAQGYIKIAENINGKPQVETSCVNTYVHEAVHCILDTMGRQDLSNDEVFVSCFAGFATEMLYSMEFDDKKNDK